MDFNVKTSLGAQLQKLTLFLFVAVGNGCETEPPIYKSVRIEGVPHVKQKPDFCGEAAAEMFLRKLGEEMDQDYVFDRAGIDPSLGRGLYAAELARSLRRIGFEVGPVWTEVASEQTIRREFESMLEDLRQGIPSIIGMYADDSPAASEHFRLVLGYDGASDEVIYHEPALDDGAYLRMKRGKFTETWPLGRGEKRTLVRFRLKQAALEYGRASEGITEADLAQYVLRLRREGLSDKFTVAVAKPFVIIGDEPEETVARRARTVAMAVAELKADYFERDPREINLIWVFKDANGYNRYTKLLFDEEPISVYGFFNPDAEMMLMNISYGNGTMLHEMVHAFIQADFPKCPTWLNEGLGSLYETSTFTDEGLVAITNWRLIGLKEAIRAGETVPIEALTAMDEDTFYGPGSGTYYAQARFLMQYLHDTGRLSAFYKAAKQNAATDPSGVETLKATLEQPDLGVFQKQLHDWVMGLGFETLESTEN